MREGWKGMKIADICEKASSNIALNKIQDIDGDYPIYGASGYIKNVDFYHRDKAYIGVVKDGSGVGRVNTYPPMTSLLGTMQYILPKDGYCLGYVAYALKSLNLASFASGAAIPHIYFRDYGQCEICVPSLQEQERIVAELDLLTGIIDKQKQQLKELDTLAQSIFYDMFGSPDANEKEWIMKSLAEIGTIVSGSTPSTSDESNWDGDVNWVTPAELGVQLFYGETRRKITSKAAKSLIIMPIGTLLMSSRAPIGKLAITSVPMCCNQGFKNIVCGNNVNNIYLYYCLMLNINSIKAMGRGATFKEVSKQAVSSFEIMLPPMNLQELFAQKILSIESQKKSINRSIAESQKLFDYTMDKYFG